MHVYKSESYKHVLYFTDISQCQGNNYLNMIVFMSSLILYNNLPTRYGGFLGVSLVGYWREKIPLLGAALGV